MNYNQLPDDNTQFVLSYELLCLLQWLVEHDANKFKKIIAKAVANGLHKKIQQVDNTAELTITDDMHHNIIDFLELLEEFLLEAINEHVAQKAREKNLLPAIDQIDLTACDDATVRSSIEKATKKVEHNPNTNPKEQLFKELLKRWKPHNKNTMN